LGNLCIFLPRFLSSLFIKSNCHQTSRVSSIPYFDLTSHDLSEVGPLDFPFNCAEVRKGILKLKNNKQPGIDLVPNELFDNLV
jgi:hypothetical protein